VRVVNGLAGGVSDRYGCDLNWVSVPSPAHGVLVAKDVDEKWEAGLGLPCAAACSGRAVEGTPRLRGEEEEEGSITTCRQAPLVWSMARQGDGAVEPAALSFHHLSVGHM
jgi:hypothetical protein